ncbi:MAG TPA: phospholipase, partial [Bacteroidota bacterium]|nr:phospholipase [Bacteroidota bacterium]
YALALTKPTEVAGVVANSGYIPEETDLQFQWDALNGTPFFVSHGLHDPVIPVQFGRRARFLLEQAHVDLTYHEYPIGHQISEESLRDMSAWLTEKLNNKIKNQN